MSTRNQYAIGVSNNANVDKAASEAIAKVAQQLDSSVDLMAVFCSGYESDHLERLAEHTNVLSSSHLLGSNCAGVIGGSKEFYNDEPNMVVWTAKLPDTQLTSFHLQYEQSIDGGAFTGWPEDTTCLDGDCVLLTVGDPYSFPMDMLLHRLNEDRPGVKVIGGMASGSARPGDLSLFHGDQPKNFGATFVAFQGENLPVPLVSQGCRPVGSPMIITACERNEIQSLGGKPATQQLFDLFDSLPTREQKQLNSGLHMGLALTEYKDTFGYGDFLIRNVIGYDKNSGAINIGAFARVGQTVQFHVRDHETATLDLKEASSVFVDSASAAAQSALLFSCNGRGPHLFSEPHHDASLLSESLGIETLAGFFAAGEIGPVGGQNHVHGFTASAAIFL